MKLEYVADGVHHLYIMSIMTYRFDGVGPRFNLDPFVVDHREVLDGAPR